MDLARSIYLFIADLILFCSNLSIFVLFFAMYLESGCSDLYSFKLFKKECIERKVDKVIIPGDVFTAKTQATTVGLLSTKDAINDIAQEFETYIIVGNHDIATANDNKVCLPNIWKKNPNIMGKKS